MERQLASDDFLHLTAQRQPVKSARKYSEMNISEQNRSLDLSRGYKDKEEGVHSRWGGKDAEPVYYKHWRRASNMNSEEQ